MLNDVEIIQATQDIKRHLAISSDSTRELVGREIRYRWNTPYGMRNSGLGEYQYTFSRVIPGTIEAYVEGLKSAVGDHLYGLDLMGEGQPLRDLGIRGLAVTCFDYRAEEEREQLVGHNIRSEYTPYGHNLKLIKSTSSPHKLPK